MNLRRLQKLTTLHACATSAEYSSYRAYCLREGLLAKGDANTLRADLRALLPNAEGLAADLLARENELKEERFPKLRARVRDFEEKYGLRRLLTLYRAFEKSKPQTGGSLRAFCQKNEEAQAVDAAYAARGLPLVPLSGEAAWRWMANSGSSESELSAIQSYTGDFYKKINPAIWRARASRNPEALTEANDLFIKTLDAGLSRALPYRAGPVIRFAELPKEILANHTVGKTVTYEAFTSTSKKKDWAWSPTLGSALPPGELVVLDAPAEGTSILNRFVIYPGKRGVAVESISKSPDEAEVLFRPGTRFKVLSRKPRQEAPGAFDFVMAEVDEAGRVIGGPQKQVYAPKK